MSGKDLAGSLSDHASLTRIAVLRDVAPDVIAKMAQRARWRSVAPGELILDFGDASDDVFFVLSGTLQVLLRTSGGKEFLFGEVEQGGCFGEMAIIEGKARSANVTARTAARLCIVSGAAFLDAMLASPPLCLQLLRLMSNRLRENSERLLEIATFPVRQRLAATLLRLGRPRPGEPGTLVLSPPPTHQVLSVLIGARREAVSREMVDLADAGLIETSRRAIVIRQAGALEQRARQAHRASR